MEFIIETNDSLETSELVELYQSINWSAAEKPDLLCKALLNSHTLVTARVDGKLVGIGNAISDGYLVVYYPHLLVHKEYQGKGIGRAIMEQLLEPYHDFHQQMITADSNAIGFYESFGFTRAEGTDSMWIYHGDDH